MEIPILKTNRKKTVPKRLMMLIMVKLNVLMREVINATYIMVSTKKLEGEQVES